MSANKINFVKASNTKAAAVVKNGSSKSFDNCKKADCSVSKESLNFRCSKKANDKYFVRSGEMIKKITQKGSSSFDSTTKSKGIVFNLNINRDRLSKAPTTTQNILRSEGLFVPKPSESDVISVSSSSSSSSKCEVILTSESESD